MNFPYFLLVLLGLPLGTFVLWGVLWLLGVSWSERVIGRTVKLVYAFMMLAFLMLCWQVYQQPQHVVEIRLGDWFQLDHYEYPMAFQLDGITMPFVGLTIVLSGLVASFSVTYLHRDPGYLRFFLLLMLFSFGSLLVFTAGSLDLLIGGWELVGITSVLLIAFFQYRPEPVKNALRVFATYRVADLCILVAVFLAHQWYGSAEWSRFREIVTHQDGHAVPGGMFSFIAVLLVFAASGKSAQGPFCGWLARAMEGPTPSSAIFYGAFSVHAGPYLLLRAAPIIHESTFATVLLFFIGGTTAIFATMIQRSCSDAKTSLAYASQTQLGMIFCEIAMGWHTVAMMHVIGHATVRAMQFLRSPSMLSDYHRQHAGSGGVMQATGKHYDALLPLHWQRKWYCFALFRGFHESFWERIIGNPLYAFIRLLAKIEQWPTRQKDVPEQASSSSLPVID
jgi:NAD(P)H-quinone oxidoreductase subunit 5